MNKNIEFYYKDDSENRKVLYSLSIIWNSISTRLDSILSKFDLNISKFNILMIIKHIGSDEGIQQNEISKRLLVTPSNITKLLDKLEKDELITRNAKKNDRRVNLIKVTEKASRLLDNIWPIYVQETDKLTENLEKKDIKDLKNILIRWLSYMK